MAGMSGLYSMISALSSSQQALNTSAHNLANIDTDGYSRQQVLMTDNNYDYIGNNETTGFYVGLGTDVDTVRQVRDVFLDMSYREEAAAYGYYSTMSGAVEEVEALLGESGEISFADTLDDLWESMSELAKDPDGLETRAAFVQNAMQFAEHSNRIMDDLVAYQENIDVEVEDMVDRVNEIGAGIHALNDAISTYELTDGNANDYRDARNVLIDELASYVDVSYSEDSSGSVTVKIENIEFVHSSGYNEIELTTNDGNTYYEPVWSHLTKTDGTNYSVFNLDEEITSSNDNDNGELKALLQLRGTNQAYYTDMLDEDSFEDIEQSLIMKSQAQFDNLVYNVATMINEVVDPETGDQPYGLDGSQGIEIFSRINADTGEAEDEDDKTTLYTASNIEVNSIILNDYDKICISSTVDDVSDTTYVNMMLDAWDEESIQIEPGIDTKYSISGYYAEFIGDVASYGGYVKNIAENEELILNQVDNERSAVSGVSSDEELGYVIMYQNAYSAAAKVINTVDEMIERIIDNTGIVGR